MSTEKEKKPEGIRVAKLIAASGRCSRREAEELIVEGRVKVNGVTITTPATFITDHSVKIDDKLISAKGPTRLWIFHKPVGYLTTTKTLTAGATVITGHLTANGGGGGNAFRSATAVAQIVIEDLGST